MPGLFPIIISSTVDLLKEYFRDFFHAKGIYQSLETFPVSITQNHFNQNIIADFLLCFFGDIPKKI